MVKRFLIMFVVAIFLFPSMTDALLVDGSDFYGSRSTRDSSGIHGIYGIYGWDSSSGGFKITWDIIDQGTYFSYSYTFSDENGNTPLPNNALSHWIFEVSGIVTEDNFDRLFWNFMYDSSSVPGDDIYGPQNWDNSPGNPDMPGIIYGIKLDDVPDVPDVLEATKTISFNSYQPPMWGDFYAKDGGNPKAQAWNMGLGSAPTSDNRINFIPVPDTGNHTPEPATILLLGVGLIGLAGFRKRCL